MKRDETTLTVERPRTEAGRKLVPLIENDLRRRGFEPGDDAVAMVIAVEQEAVELMLERRRLYRVVDLTENEAPS